MNNRCVTGHCSYCNNIDDGFNCKKCDDNYGMVVSVVNHIGPQVAASCKL